MLGLGDLGEEGRGLGGTNEPTNELYHRIMGLLGLGFGERLIYNSMFSRWGWGDGEEGRERDGGGANWIEVADVWCRG